MEAFYPTSSSTPCMYCSHYCRTLCYSHAEEEEDSGRQLDDEEPSVTDTMSIKWSESESGWVSIKRALMGTVRWSRAGKWEETDNGAWKETAPPPPLLVGGGCELGVGWQSHNSVSPVWQRPILMGERCELPRFSGLILYDEGGRPLDHSSGVTHQEKTATVVTTLRDLL